MLRVENKGRTWLALLTIACICSGAFVAFGQGKKESTLREILRSRVAIPEQNSHGGKCGLWLYFELLRNWNLFDGVQKQQILRLLAKPSTQKDRIIGHFHFYYNTTGDSAASLIDSNYLPIPGTSEQFVDSAGVYFNHVWTYEIDSLGYQSPPVGADGTYPVVIANLGTGTYGQTVWEGNPINAASPPRYVTHVEVDNTFSYVYLPSRGLPALKVTAAHEFHHAIQIGSYGLWSSDQYFYEITSTWMEDEVYNEVNDYYQYLSNGLGSQFAHPEDRFTDSDPRIQIYYSRAIWGKFIEKRFSRDMMRTTWENIRQVIPLQAIDEALATAGSSFRDAFLEWSYWNANTGPNCDTVAFYPEGRNYPPIALRSIVEFTPPERLVDDSIQVLSSIYHPIIVSNNTMLAIIANINTSSDGTSNLLPFSYDMKTSGGAGFKKLANGIFVKINAADPENWTSWESVPTQTPDVIAFPNPFIARGNRLLKFRLPSATQTTAVLHVFSSSMAKFSENELPVKDFRPFEPVIEWDGHDSNGNSVPTGIYFYIIEIDQNKYEGKFAVIKE